MTPEQNEKLENFIRGDDLNFYEEFVIHLSDEKQNCFFIENPDFMSEFPVDRKRLYLLKDKIFRRILRCIKDYQSKINDTSCEQ